MEIVALDKTGTITAGEPKVTGIIPAEGLTEQELFTLAYVWQVTFNTGLHQQAKLIWKILIKSSYHTNN